MKIHLIGIKIANCEYVFVRTTFFEDNAVEFMSQTDLDSEEMLRIIKEQNAIHFKNNSINDESQLFLVSSIDEVMERRPEETHFISIFDEDGTVWQDVLDHNKTPRNHLYIADEMNEPVVGETKGSWIHLHDEEQEMLSYSEGGEPIAA